MDTVRAVGGQQVQHLQNLGCYVIGSRYRGKGLEPRCGLNSAWREKGEVGEAGRNSKEKSNYANVSMLMC